MSVVTSKDVTAAVMGMMGTAPTCAMCFVPCGSKPEAEKQGCALACGDAPLPPGGKPCKDMAAAAVKGLSGAFATQFNVAAQYNAVKGHRRCCV
jgi:hypothetical protein